MNVNVSRKAFSICAFFLSALCAQFPLQPFHCGWEELCVMFVSDSSSSVLSLSLML